jgi:hypothetical protein
MNILGTMRDALFKRGNRGDTKDSAAMNIWLHKEVIRLFAANGGKVPAELLN